MKTSSFLLKQGSISTTSTILLLILSLLFVNWQINILGIEKYGLLVLLLSIFGTINMLNIGIGTAIVDYYTKFGEEKSVFWSIYIASFLILIILSGIIVLTGSIFYQNIFSFLALEKENLNLMTFYGVSLIGISRLLSSITLSYWVAKVDFFKLKLFGFINIYLPISVILVLYSYGLAFNKSLFFAGIINFIFIIALTGNIILSVINIKTLNIMKNFKIHFKKFISDGLQFQGIAIINNLSNPIINIMINTYFGLEAISLFDIALKFLRSGRQIIVSATEPFFGKITQLHNQNKKRLMHLLVRKYTKYMMIVGLLYIVMTFSFSNFILTLWMGKDITFKTYYIVNIITIGFAINLSASIIYNKFLAVKRLRKYVLIHQIILFVLSIAPFLLKLEDMQEYSIYYSISFIISSLYLLAIFYSQKRRIY